MKFYNEINLFSQMKNIVELSVSFPTVEAVADQKALFHLKTGIINSNFNPAPLFFVNEGTGAD
jgi:hypothetical protein